jgi:hypothetical protein
MTNKRLVAIGLITSLWFCLNNLVAGTTGQTPRLIDAVVFAVGSVVIYVGRSSLVSRVAMLLMAVDWFASLVMRLPGLSLTAVIWDGVYLVMWSCGVVGVFGEQEFSSSR